MNTLFAQQKNAMTEEDYVVLKYKIRSNFNSNIDSALVYANQMAKSHNYKHLAFANGAMSTLLQLKGKTGLSKEKYKKALYYLNKLPGSRDKIQLESYILNFVGSAEWKRGNFSAAIEQYQKGIKRSVIIGDINQIVKIKGNITLVNESVGNYQLAIANARELNNFLHENKDLFPKEEFLNRKSNINLSLGSSYEGYFMKNKSKKYLLDSAEYFYKRTIDYSQNLTESRISAKLSLGNVYNWRGDYKSALKTYLEVASLSQKYDQKNLLCIANYNLADIYSTIKKYDKALLFYKRCDSIALLSNLNALDYLKSNYYQSKIYTILKKPELAYKHSQIYLDSKKKYDAKLNAERLKVNDEQGIDNLTKEMISVEKSYEKEIFTDKAMKVFYALLIAAIIYLFIKNSSDKNKTNKKMNALIQEFKTNIEKKNDPESAVLLFGNGKIFSKKENVNLSIDETKENEIVEKLLELENRLEYLNMDFTLIYVAKRIKTNTTYLSYVVNKRFGKSFGEYSNELKLNYAINEMITNEVYRKNSTQVIAESVGFKNAGSFAQSFRKRTGVSPVQFANNI